MGLSIRAYARHRGVSDAAVRKAIATGRITPEADGTVDPERADAVRGAVAEGCTLLEVPQASTRADINSSPIINQVRREKAIATPFWISTLSYMQLTIPSCCHYWQ